MGRVDKAGKPEFRAREASEKRGAVWGGSPTSDVFYVTCRVALLCTALYDVVRRPQVEPWRRREDANPSREEST